MRVFGETSNPSNADSPLEKGGGRLNVPAGIPRRKKTEAFDRIMGNAFGAIFQSTLKHSWRPSCLRLSAKRDLEWDREEWMHRGHGCAAVGRIVRSPFALGGTHTGWSLIRAASSPRAGECWVKLAGETAKERLCDEEACFSCRESFRPWWERCRFNLVVASAVFLLRQKEGGGERNFQLVMNRLWSVTNGTHQETTIQKTDPRFVVAVTFAVCHSDMDLL